MDKLDQILSKLSEIERNQSRIEQKLLGDDKWGDKGIIEMVNEHQQHIQAAKMDKAKLIGFSVGSGMAGSGILAYIKSLFS